MPNEKINDSSVFERLKEAFESLMSENSDFEHEKYPKEALPLGTIVKSIKHDRLGAIYDAFYGDLDKDNNKIIIYTILLFPEANIRYKKLDSGTFYLSNEYEYDILAFLMIPPIDMDILSRHISLGTL